MRRRRALCIVCVVIPLALGWWARIAASWRPVPLAHVSSSGYDSFVLCALPDRVAYRVEGERSYGWFDLKTQRLHKDPSHSARRIGMDGKFSWVLWMEKNSRNLEVTDEHGKQRGFTAQGVSYPERWEPCVRVLPAQNRVILLDESDIHEWEFTTGHLKRVVTVATHPPHVLSRDGRNFIGIEDGFTIGDARSGKAIRQIPFRTSSSMEYDYFSPYGHYDLFEQNEGLMKVVDVATGQRLWDFEGDWVFDQNEENILVATKTDWQVRELKTGRLLERLPRLPGELRSAAISPDGTTLYSISKGVLYKQRVL